MVTFAIGGAHLSVLPRLQNENRLSLSGSPKENSQINMTLLKSSNPWREVMLEEVADELTVGYVGPMASEYVPSGIPFLRSQNVEPLRVIQDDIKFITPDFHNRISKSALSPGNVVIVRTGKPGACTVMPDSLPVANCSDLVIVRCGKNLDARFLAYYVN